MNISNIRSLRQRHHKKKVETDRSSQKAKTGEGTSCCCTIVLKTGVRPSTAISGKAMPRIPSNLAATNVRPGSLVASANGWLRAQMFATYNKVRLIYANDGWNERKFCISRTIFTINTRKCSRLRRRYPSRRSPSSSPCRIESRICARPPCKCSISRCCTCGATLNKIIKERSAVKSNLTACNIVDRALLRRHPQVRGSGVENDGEILRRATNRDLSIILRLKELREMKRWNELSKLRG